MDGRGRMGPSSCHPLSRGNARFVRLLFLRCAPKADRRRVWSATSSLLPAACFPSRASNESSGLRFFGKDAAHRASGAEAS